MSENKPGTPQTPTATPGASSSTDLPGVSKPASTAIPTPDAPSGIPSAPAETTEAAARASTDAPESASAVTPADPPARTRQQIDAAEARASAALSTAKQEAEVHDREKASRHGTPVSSTTQAAAAAGKGATGSSGQASSAASSASAGSSGSSSGTAGAAPGSPPPGFTSQPDFTASNPPPPNAMPPSTPRYLRQNDSAWSVFGRIIAARARQLFDRAGQRITQRTLRIGVSARIFHPEPGAKGLRGKTLQYLEE
jgi:hypothetical protein